MSDKVFDIKDIRYSVFAPKTERGLLDDYPELKKVPEFKRLSKYDMLFVWYYACESSPLNDIDFKDNRDRIQKAIELSYLSGRKKKISNSDIEKYKSGAFPSKVEVGCERMRKYKVGVRIKALKALEKSFDNLLDQISKTPEEKDFLDKDGVTINYSQKKAYVDMIAQGSKTLPSMINQIEGQFYVTEEKDAESTFDGENFIDDHHDNSE